MDSIDLCGMKFYGYHGCFAEEREKGQYFFIDVSLYMDLSIAGKNDDLQATVDYGKVMELVRSIVEGRPVSLIECLAQRIAEAVRRDFAVADRVKVTVHKPSAPLPTEFQDASVTIER